MPTEYATANDVEVHLGTEEYLAITDRDADGGEDSDAVTSALAKANALIDGYVAARLPAGGVLPNVPVWLKQAAIDIAVYSLLKTPSKAERDKYDDAQRLLRDVSAGRLKLGVEVAPSQMEADIEYDGPEQTMSREQMAGIL